jgi:hypothetical protein
MDATKTTEPKKDSQRQYANLDKRYGKIEISAVAAALHHQDATRTTPAPDRVY